MQNDLILLLFQTKEKFKEILFIIWKFQKDKFIIIKNIHIFLQPIQELISKANQMVQWMKNTEQDLYQLYKDITDLYDLFEMKLQTLICIQRKVLKIKQKESKEIFFKEAQEQLKLLENFCYLDKQPDYKSQRNNEQIQQKIDEILVQNSYNLECVQNCIEKEILNNEQIDNQVREQLKETIEFDLKVLNLKNDEYFNQVAKASCSDIVKVYQKIQNKRNELKRLKDLNQKLQNFPKIKINYQQKKRNKSERINEIKQYNLQQKIFSKTSFLNELKSEKILSNYIKYQESFVEQILQQKSLKEDLKLRDCLEQLSKIGDSQIQQILIQNINNIKQITTTESEQETQIKNQFKQLQQMHQDHASMLESLSYY